VRELWPGKKGGRWASREWAANVEDALIRLYSRVPLSGMLTGDRKDFQVCRTALTAILIITTAVGLNVASAFAGGSPDVPAAEESQLARLALRLSGWDTLPGSLQPNQPCSFLVGQAGPMDKVFREAADFPGPYGTQVRIAAAGRERESLQLVVLPVGEPLKSVRVDVSDLLHEDGATRLPASAVSWHPVGYIQTKPANSPARRVGWQWPDVLMPTAPFDVELGFVQPIWFTVNVPAGAKAGIYRGLITFRPAGVEGQTVELELTVRSFSLPERGKLKTALSFNPGLWVMWYRPDEVKQRLALGDQSPWEVIHDLNSSWECADLLPPEKWREIYDFLLDHRLNPTTIYAHLRNGGTWVLPSRQEMQYCYERGMNATCLLDIEARFVPPDPQKANTYLRELETWLADWDRFAKEKNWPDFTWYVNGFDESDWQRDPETRIDPLIRRIYGEMGAKFPRIKRESANPLNAAHVGLFDIWTPLTSQWTSEWSEEIAKRRAAGEEMWAYVAVGPAKPYANLLVDSPGLDPRILPWQLYQHGVTGFLYWQLDCYYPGQENWNMAGPKWPDRPWNTLIVGTNNDGVLMYPGPGAVPLASTRLENLRDGIEDYEALAMLAELTSRLEAGGGRQQLIAEARAVLAVPATVTSSWTDYTHDPGVIVRGRAEVDRLIEAVLAAISQVGGVH